MRALAALIRREGLTRTARAALGVLRDFGWQGVWRRARRLAGTAEHDAEYVAWQRRHTFTDIDRPRLAAAIAGWTRKPLVSIVTPVYDTDPRWLRACLASVRQQVYPHWELLLCDDASTREETRAVLRECVQPTGPGAEADPRIRVIHLPARRHISGASNAGLAAARGDFVALLDHDDELAPDALAEVVGVLQEDPEIDLIYSDEDKRRADGVRVDPFFKPGWSPAYLRACMYLGHLLVVRRSAIEAAGGFRDAYSGAQDYDLALRVTDRTTRIRHIPRVLYHWRMADGSSARVGSAKPWAAAAAIGALQDHARRHEIDAAIEPAQGYGLYSWTHRPGSASTLISVIATGGQAADLERLREATAYPRVEWIAAEAGPEWPAAVNAAVRRAKGRHVAIVDSRLAPASADWLERLVAQLAYPPTAIVTPRIDGADGVIASVGLALGVGAGWAPVLEGAESTTLGYFGNAVVPHECAAASHACLVVPRTVLEAAGGFDERLGPDGAAVALSLAVRRGGSHVVCAADVRLQWQLPQQPPDSRDAERLRPAWPAALVNDPYFNRNFDRARADFRLERTSRSGE